MGDHGNIVLRFKDGDQTKDIYLYTHWAGSKIADILQAALIRGEGLWEDGPYLALTIFKELIKGDGGGHAISPYECDNERNYLVVDMEGGKTVTVEDKETHAPGKKLSFEEFVSLEDPSAFHLCEFRRSVRRTPRASSRKPKRAGRR